MTRTVRSKPKYLNAMVIKAAVKGMKAPGKKKTNTKRKK